MSNVETISGSSSFPTRERGLKSARGKEDQIRTSSFPTRERGLKWQCSGECHRDPGSFPTRERGLKLNIINFCMSVYSRSPRGNVD